MSNKLRWGFVQILESETEPYYWNKRWPTYGTRKEAELALVKAKLSGVNDMGTKDPQPGEIVRVDRDMERAWRPT